MRVNVDSAALHDPRFRRAARALTVSHYEVLARAICVWMVCYDRRAAIIPREDIDIAADLDGFADALVKAELAEQVSDRELYVRGVTERISFLEKQSEKGKKSGEARRAVSDALQKRTTVQQGFAFGSTGGSTEPRTYSPDLDHAHALDQAPRRDSESGARTRQAQGTANAVPRGETPTPTSRIAPAPNGEAVGPAKASLPEPPDEALTLAVMLLDSVVANHPGSRVAHQASKRREATVSRWAWVLEKLHRLDGQSWGAILGMIEWSSRHTFWNKAILGADSLRENWDKMNAQRNRGHGPNGHGPNARVEPRKGPTAQALDEHDALERAAAEDKPRNDGAP